MTTKKSSKWDDFFGNLLNDDDKKTDYNHENDMSSSEILGICYTVIVSLILLSNLSIIMLIVCTKLRRKVFCWKIVICSVGDIIFGIILPFQIMSSLDKRRAWYYGELFCNISHYISSTHLMFIALALCSLCSDRILKSILKRRSCFISCHVLLFLLPFAGIYFGLIPILARSNIVSFQNFTVSDDKYAFCETSKDYREKKILTVVITEILLNTIFLPALFLLVILLIYRYRKRQTIQDIEDNEDETTNHSTISVDDTKLMSSSIAVIIVTIVTVVCTIPHSVLYFCSPDCLSENETRTTNDALRQYVYVLSLIPSVARPYLWLFDVDMRNSVRHICCRCCENDKKK